MLIPFFLRRAPKKEKETIGRRFPEKRLRDGWIPAFLPIRPSRLFSLTFLLSRARAVVTENEKEEVVWGRNRRSIARLS